MPQSKEQRKVWYRANREKIAAYKKSYYATHGNQIRDHVAEYRRANPLLIKARKRKWYAENRERLNEATRQRYHANRGTASATAAARYQLHRAEVIAKTAQWQKDNPVRNKELRADFKHRRRAWQNTSAIGRVSYVKVRERNGMWCGICKTTIVGKFHYDHIIPLSKGGPHITENLQLAHPDCNRRKAAKIPLTAERV